MGNQNFERNQGQNKPGQNVQNPGNMGKNPPPQQGSYKQGQNQDKSRGFNKGQNPSQGNTQKTSGDEDEMVSEKEDLYGETKDQQQQRPEKQ